MENKMEMILKLGGMESNSIKPSFSFRWPREQIDFSVRHETFILQSNEYAILWQVIFSVMKRAMQDEDVSDGAGLSLYTAEI